MIKEKIDSWKITFIEEDNDDGDRNFEIVKPIIPEGFTVTQEEELENNYFLLVENAAGEAITYDQRLPEGAAIRVDSEYSENATEIINEHEVLISKDEQTTTFICNDGKYIYQIYGNADESVLREIMMSIIK